MEEVRAYKANNGRLFEDKDKCLAYEKKLAKYPKVKETLITAQPYMTSEWNVDVPIVKHIIEIQNKPSSPRKVEVYYIVGEHYKFIGITTNLDKDLMSGNFFKDGKPSTDCITLARSFAEEIINGNVLDDSFVITKVNEINSLDKKQHNSDKMQCLVVKKDKKWEFDNPLWRTGCVAPYKFSIEKI